MQTHRCLSLSIFLINVCHHTNQAVICPYRDQKKPLTTRLTTMNPKSNHLLSEIADSEYELIHRGLQLISLKKGDQLFCPGGLIEYAYFPVNALISISVESKDGVSLDMAMVGEEGAIGLRGLFFNICPYRVCAATSGLAYVIHLKELSHLCRSGTWLHRMYIQANEQILEQIAAETSCAKFHSISQRVARWLLIRGHRTRSRLVEATHQSMANSLGIRREAVTLALLKLTGIAHGRGQIEIQDFFALENEACDCYRPHFESTSYQKMLPFHSHAMMG